MSDIGLGGGITLKTKTWSVPSGIVKTDQPAGDYNPLTVLSSMSRHGSLFPGVIGIGI